MNELVTLATERLSLTIALQGAEMQSVVCDGIERLWCGDPAVWNRRAPLLFPLIGRLRDGCYEIDGKPVEAPRHGFCRDRLFELVHHDSASALFSTHDDENTLAVFPFSFRLDVAYALEGGGITKTIRVENTGNAPLPFELGGHEAYATCLFPGETMGDYYVQFEESSRLSRFAMDENGILDLPKVELPLESGRLTKTPEQLDVDTIVLENVPGSTVTLASGKHDRTVTVDFPDFPYLGIWTKPMGADTRFLCLEPWSALPDAHFAPRELSQKPGVRTVMPGRTTELSYRMTFR